MSEPGRRSASSRSAFNPMAMLGVLLPLVTVGVLLAVGPQASTDPARKPEETRLSTVSIACPTALAGAETAYVATGGASVEGAVSVTSAGNDRSLPVRSQQVSSVDAVADPLVVTGTDGLAPSLLAARFGDGDLAAVDCPSPVTESWFTGVGAGARHSSVLELVNPDDGPAVADITVHGRGGLIDSPRLRGLTVRGHDSVRLDLGKVIPRRSELALHVVVSRGRLSSTILDEIPALGASPETSDWLPSQPEPATRTVLLGLPPGEVEDDLLIVANQGEDEARVTLKILTPDSAFAPQGLDEIRVPPASVRTVQLTRVVREAITDGAVGVELSSSVPVTSSLRSVVAGDLSHAVPVLRVRSATSALVPPGTASVVLADADTVGVATVTSWSADGRELGSQRVELQPGAGATVDLPRGAALVRVAPQRTSVRAAALVTGPGATVVPFRQLVTDALIPDVRPGLP